MRFIRIGTRHQLRIEHAEDLEAILELDESLWAATSAPVSAFHCDPVLLKGLDRDQSGRIDTGEFKTAIAWTLRLLRNREGLNAASDQLVLDSLDGGQTEAAALDASARHILKALGVGGDPACLSLAEVRRFQSTMRALPLNGDGIVVADSADDPALRAYLNDAITCTGGRTDAGGQQGVDDTQLKAFQAAITAQLAWRRKGLPQDDGSSSAVFPFGEHTAAGEARLRKLAPRIERYFELCRAMQFAPAAAALTSGGPAKPVLADFSPWEADATDFHNELARLPTAMPRSDTLLPLSADAINPVDWPDLAWLKTHILAPLTGRPVEQLNPESWEQAQQAFAPYRAYLAEQPGPCARNLPTGTLERYADGQALEQALALTQADLRVGALLKGVADLERLVLSQSNLIRLANNFVNVSELYDADKSALFEMGAAVIDGRWFALSLPVEDLAGHMAMAKTGGLFTLYAELQRPGTDKRLVALPATAYTRGNLGIGKRGVFFDREGRQFDLRIVQVIDNPISFREALYAPFVRIWDFLVGKIESIAAANEKQLQQNVDGMTPTASPAGGAARPAMFGGPAGAFLGVSMSMAALGSALAFMTRTLGSMKLFNLLGGVLAGVALLMLPLSLVAVTKLMRQDLSGLLEASGWAINTRLRLTWTQRRQFTRRHPYPPGAEGLPSSVRSGFWIVLGLTLAIWIIRRYLR